MQVLYVVLCIVWQTYIYHVCVLLCHRVLDYTSAAKRDWPHIHTLSA